MKPPGLDGCFGVWSALWIQCRRACGMWILFCVGGYLCRRSEAAFERTEGAYHR